jgi:hypothetical protein
MVKSVRSVMMRPVEHSACRKIFHLVIAVIASFCCAKKNLGARFQYMAINHATQYMVAI